MSRWRIFTAQALQKQPQATPPALQIPSVCFAWHQLLCTRGAPALCAWLGLGRGRGAQEAAQLFPGAPSRQEDPSKTLITIEGLARPSPLLQQAWAGKIDVIVTKIASQQGWEQEQKEPGPPGPHRQWN